MAKLEDMFKSKPKELPAHPPCGFCGSRNTEFMALFGQFLLVSQYYCGDCHSAFEWVKHQGEGDLQVPMAAE
ncbi:MAG: hypothetical protein R3C62_25650 [Chloroflexota bacterium]